MTPTMQSFVPLRFLHIWFKVGHLFTASAWDSFTHQSAQDLCLVLDYIENYWATPKSEGIGLIEMGEILKGKKETKILADGSVMTAWIRHDGSISDAILEGASE